MRQMLRNASCLFLFALGPLFGQGLTLAGAGYTDPSIITVAPGQVITLFVTGLKTVLPTEPTHAATVPLPTSLAGISVTMSRAELPTIPVPLLSLRQLPICGNRSDLPPPSGFPPDCLITAITVQIPFEAPLPSEGISTTTLTVSENGVGSMAFTILPVPSSLHILNWCDPFPVRSANLCGGVVTHGDGSPVTIESPAKAGETLVIYAFGLGRTTPAVETGAATPTSAPVLLETTVIVDFVFAPNALTSSPFPFELPEILQAEDPRLPEFVGLTPGQVGLYQINVRLPDNLPPVVPCSLQQGIVSNLTINVLSSTAAPVGPPSLDRAPICVQPPQ